MKWKDFQARNPKEVYLQAKKLCEELHCQSGRFCNYCYQHEGWYCFPCKSIKELYIERYSQPLNIR